MIRFRNITFPFGDSPRKHEASPVIVELTVRGDLVFHNWDRESDLAMAELGFDIVDIPCLFLETYWGSVFVADKNEAWNASVDPLPGPLRAEVVRVRNVIYKKGINAIHESRYYASEQLPNAVNEILIIEGMNPSGRERVNATNLQLWDNDLPCPELVAVNLAVYYHTTVQALMDVLAFIPSGVVAEEHGDKMFIVLAVDEYIDDGCLIARVGCQKRNEVSVRSTRAIIERHGKRDEWRVKEWFFV